MLLLKTLSEVFDYLLKETYYCSFLYILYLSVIYDILKAFKITSCSCVVLELVTSDVTSYIFFFFLERRFCFCFV